MRHPPRADRHLGLLGATGVGVGETVGGEILALAGTAFAKTGPAAIVAFGLNGVIALLTALSFAERASKFPESANEHMLAVAAPSRMSPRVFAEVLASKRRDNAWSVNP